MANVGVVISSPLPTGTALPHIALLARDAEAAGLDCIWAEDLLAHGDAAVLDSMCVLAAAAAATERIEVGSAVFVPSLRNLSWALKQVATVQLVAGGRLQLGVALGASGDDDYGLAGLTRSGQRQRTDEFLSILAAARRGEEEPAAPLSRTCLTAGHCAAGATAVGRRDIFGGPAPCGPFRRRLVVGSSNTGRVPSFLEPIGPISGRGRAPMPADRGSTFRLGRHRPGQPSCGKQRRRHAMGVRDLCRTCRRTCHRWHARTGGRRDWSLPRRRCSTGRSR